MGAADASPFALRVTGLVTSTLHRLPKGRTIVGRSKAGHPDVEIGEPAAAPRHCELHWDERLACHRLVVWGVNGVGMNGGPVLAGAEPRPLSPGDEFLIGDTSLRYEQVV